MPRIAADSVMVDLAAGFEALMSKANDLMARNTDLQRQIRACRQEVREGPPLSECTQSL